MKLPTLGPLVITAVGFASTAMLGTFAAREENLREARRFEELSAAVGFEIQQHVNAHRDALIGARAHLMEARLDRASFDRYVTALDLAQRYKGFQGLGYTKHVLRPALEREVAALRKEWPGFRVWPEGERDAYTMITYLSPETARNLRAIGFDMYNEEIRREAMDRATRTGEAAITGKVTLVQDDPAPAPGFLMYVPVYAADKSLGGFVYSPCNARLFFEGVLATAPARELDLEIYDGEAMSTASALYANGPKLLGPTDDGGRARRILVGGRTWTLFFAPRASLQRPLLARNATWAVSFGVLATFALATAMHRSSNARRRAERELHAREEFLTLAAHELKTPLTPLRLQIQALRRAFGDDVDPKIAKRLEGLQKASERLTALVVTLLESGARGRDSGDVNVEEVDLAAIVRDVAARMEDAFHDAGCTVTVDAAEPVVGRWDRVRLEQVVVNVLANAAKYGHDSAVEIRVAREGARARLVVRDHGIGVAPEDRERVFAKFERGVSSRNYTGLGVGLWIVKRVVEGARGTIRVEETPGGGATFVIELPL